MLKRFPECLKEARSRARLSQRALSEKVGIADSYISRMETGAFPPPSRDVTVKLADRLGMSKSPLTLYVSTKDKVALERFVFFLAAYVAGGEDVQAIKFVEMEDDKVGQVITQGTPAQQLPSVTAIDGAVFQQMLTQLQQLMATVTQLHANVAAFHPPQLASPSDVTVPDSGEAQPIIDLDRLENGAFGIITKFAAKERQEPEDSGVVEFEEVRGMLYRIISELEALPPLDKPHSGRIMLTYTLEEDAFRDAPELEQQWFQGLKRAIAKGWDIFHFIWLTEDVQRTAHLVQNIVSLLGGCGSYQVYFTKSKPLGSGYDFLAVDAPVDHLKRAFELHALQPTSEEGVHHTKSGRLLLPPNYKQIDTIVNLLKRWKEGEGGFQPLLRVEQEVEQDLQKNLDAVRRWDELVTEVEEQEGDLLLVMKGFAGNTVPDEQYVSQLKRILEGNNKEHVDFIRHALDLWTRRVTAFQKQVLRHKFYQIIPIKAMYEYKKTGFHCPDAWAHLLEGDTAKPEQIAKHLLAIVKLLETYPDNYQIGLLIGDAGEYDKVFWMVKGTHAVLFENYVSGIELDVSIDERKLAEAFVEEFWSLWKSKRVITDQKRVQKWLRKHAKEIAAIS